MNSKHTLMRSQLNILKPFVAKCSLYTMRRAQESIERLMARNYKDLVRVEHNKIGDMKCAMITPKEELLGGVVLYIHGGGYVFNSAPHHFKLAKQMALRLKCKLVFVDYRLAPKYKFPIDIRLRCTTFIPQHINIFFT